MNDPQASIHEIGPDTFRISVALPPAIFPGGFTFNQYLVVDDKPSCATSLFPTSKQTSAALWLTF